MEFSWNFSTPPHLPFPFRPHIPFSSRLVIPISNLLNLNISVLSSSELMFVYLEYGKIFACSLCYYFFFENFLFDMLLLFSCLENCKLITSQFWVSFFKRSGKSLLIFVGLLAFSLFCRCKRFRCMAILELQFFCYS